MRVTVNCYGAVRAATGRKTVVLEFDDAATVGRALDRLTERFSDFARGRDGDLVVMLNGQHVDRADGLETPLADGDALSLSNPPMVED